MEQASVGTVSPVSAFEHEALFYRTAEDYLAGTVEFVEGGIAAGEPVFVSVPGPRVELLRGRLNGSQDRVRFADMTKVGRNPSCIIGAIRQFTDLHAGRRVRFIGEPIWVGRDEAEIREATRHEALLNVAFASTPMTILCPYDVAGLNDRTLADAHRTHPIVVAADDRRASFDYTDPAEMSALSDELPLPPTDADQLAFSHDGLPKVRRFVQRHAERLGLARDRVDDLVIGVNEVATNTLAHTHSDGVIQAWQDPGHRGLVCEVRDGGTINDPLLGRVAPSARAEGGRGLWIVNQCCDLVELRSSAAGTTIRMHVRAH